jgi:hypothetical protein
MLVSSHSSLILVNWCELLLYFFRRMDFMTGVLFLLEALPQIIQLIKSKGFQIKRDL